MRKIKLLVIFAFVLAFMMGSALANPALAAPQAKCPVMGLQVDKQVYADYKGKRIYFCCKDCEDKFKKDPETYMKKLQDEKVDLEPTPVK